MEPILIKVNETNFIIHFYDGNDTSWYGEVAQIYNFTDGTWMYISKESDEPVEYLKDARIWFDFSFSYRGIWEGRIHFKDDEYWSNEMKTIPLLWDEIESIMKEKIKSDNPDYDFCD